MLDNKVDVRCVKKEPVFILMRFVVFAGLIGATISCL